jgi:multiple sugar transport system substrate-binding protein
MNRRIYIIATLLFVSMIVLGVIGPGVTTAQSETVTLTMILVAPEERWNFLLDAAKAKFEADNPGTTIEIDAQVMPFGDRLTQLRAAAVAGTPLDIVSLDQPEVGEFAAAGFTTDLTGYINRDLDGLSDWLPAHRAATKYEGGWHAIWAWTDVRLLWYWKDLVEEAGISPETDMVTWDDYIASCQKLNEALSDQGIEGCLLIGQPWIADWTLPYAWMQGGGLGVDVNPDLAASVGATEAWLPTFDSPAWVSALQFTRDQVDAGIEPFTEHQFGPAFADRRYATWLGGTWVYGSVRDSDADMSNLGVIGAFPVPSPGMATATMAGGWTLAIPATSEQPEVAWEFLQAMLDVSTLGQMQAQFGYLPTEASFADTLAGDFESYWNEGGVDRWSELQALGTHAYGRPSFPSWPEVGSAITEMVQKVQFEDEDPLAAAQSAQQTVLGDVLGWPAGTTVVLHDDADGSCGHADVDRLISAVTPGQKVADTDGNGSICSHVILP